jgi:hypothetical protein
MAFDAAGGASVATTFDDAGSVHLHARMMLPLANGKESDNAMRGSADTAPDQGETAIAVGGGTSVADIAHAPLTSGLLGLGFSAPGSGNIGELDYRIDLGIAASEWLRDDWHGDGTCNDVPRGRASFGLYAGPRTIIYQRDIWR